MGVFVSATGASWSESPDSTRHTRQVPPRAQQRPGAGEAPSLLVAIRLCRVLWLWCCYSDGRQPWSPPGDACACSPAPPAAWHVTGLRAAGSSGARGPGTSGTPPSGRPSAPLRSPARCCSSCRIRPRTMWLAAAAPGRAPPGWPSPLAQACGLGPTRAPPRRRHRERHQPRPHGSTAPRPAHHLTAAGPGAWPTGITGAERAPAEVTLARSPAGPPASFIGGTHHAVRRKAPHLVHQRARLPGVRR
jgi:hypothetical protein